MSKFLKISLWFLLTMFVLAIGFHLLNYPNTLLVVLGFVVIVLWISISYKTKLFTKNPFKKSKKDEKVSDNGTSSASNEHDDDVMYGQN